MTSPFLFGTILEIDGNMSRRDSTGGYARLWVLPWAVGGKCSERFVGRLVGRVIVALMFGGSLGIVNPPRCMGSRFGLWRVLPLVPGFPLVGGWLVIGWVLILVVLVVGWWILMVSLVFPRCWMKCGWFAAGCLTIEVIVWPYFSSTWRGWSQIDRRSSTGTSWWITRSRMSSSVWWSWSRGTMCSSQWCGTTRTPWNRDWTFVWCPTVPMGARPRATWRVLWLWWNFTQWRRMTWNGWSSLNWWLSRSRRLVHIALLGLVHKRLHTGLHCVLHLLHHLLCIEGCTGCRWCGLRCHRCWWIRHWSCRLGRVWMECGLMEWKKLLKVLDMCLSLYSQLLIQDVILLSESRQLCLSLSLELSLWLLVHKITATKLTLKSHRLWVPEGPHVVGSGRKPSRKHGSTVRRFNKLVQTRCIHKSCKDRDKAQRPSAVKFQPYRRLKYSTPELHAQFQPHRETKKESGQTWEACPVAFKSHVKGLRSVSWETRRIVVVASGYRLLHHWNWWSHKQRAVVQHSLDRQVRPGKKASCSLYLNELPIQRCKFRHRVTVNC